MSRIIDVTKKLSDDDRLYLESRGMQRELDENVMHLMGGGANETAPDEGVETEAPAAEATTAAPESAEAVTVSAYEGVTVADLKTEIERRNADRDDETKITVEAPGNRPELVSALEADDKTAE